MVCQINFKEENEHRIQAMNKYIKRDLSIQTKGAHQNPGSNGRLETQLVPGIYLYLWLKTYVLMHWHMIVRAWGNMYNYTPGYEQAIKLVIQQEVRVDYMGEDERER